MKDLEAQVVVGHGRLTLSFPSLIYPVLENHQTLAGDLQSGFSLSFYPESSEKIQASLKSWDGFWRLHYI